MSTASNDHASASQVFLDEAGRAAWHDQALWHVRKKRDAASKLIPEWEALRNAAAQIKRHTLALLPGYLAAFEKQAVQNGVKVHWAKDAGEHNRMVLEILKSKSVSQVVKSKSMLTEECGLNPFLEKHGVAVIDTDLGERIIQLAGEHPSHIVLPAIHKKKEEVGEIFHEHLGTPKGMSDPAALAETARVHLRKNFWDAGGALTGANFAVAENGVVVVATNEGNADLGAAVAKVHLVSIGIEKLLPRFEDLGVFTRLLARSATGQAVTVYTSHFRKPKPGGELHFILVDNLRSEIHGDESFYEVLSCIRCGACMNTCPVYRRSGGHSYQATVPGPIGSILSALREPKVHTSLPFASSLCGSCTDVCPVKIPLHEQLLALRGRLVENGKTSFWKGKAFELVGLVLGKVFLFRMAGSMIRMALRHLPRFVVYSPVNGWGKKRELPLAPKKSYLETLRDLSKVKK